MSSNGSGGATILSSHHKSSRHHHRTSNGTGSTSSALSIGGGSFGGTADSVSPRVQQAITNAAPSPLAATASSTASGASVAPPPAASAASTPSKSEYSDVSREVESWANACRELSRQSIRLQLALERIRCKHAIELSYRQQLESMIRATYADYEREQKRNVRLVQQLKTLSYANYQSKIENEAIEQQLRAAAAGATGAAAGTATAFQFSPHHYATPPVLQPFAMPQPKPIAPPAVSSPPPVAPLTSLTALVSSPTPLTTPLKSTNPQFSQFTQSTNAGGNSIRRTDSAMQTPVRPSVSLTAGVPAPMPSVSPVTYKSSAADGGSGDAAASVSSSGFRQNKRRTQPAAAAATAATAAVRQPLTAEINSAAADSSAANGAVPPPASAAWTSPQPARTTAPATTETAVSALSPASVGITLNSPPPASAASSAVTLPPALSTVSALPAGGVPTVRAASPTSPVATATPDSAAGGGAAKGLSVAIPNSNAAPAASAVDTKSKGTAPGDGAKKKKKGDAAAASGKQKRSAKIMKSTNWDADSSVDDDEDDGEDEDSEAGESGAVAAAAAAAVAIEVEPDTPAGMKSPTSPVAKHKESDPFKRMVEHFVVIGCKPPSVVPTDQTVWFEEPVVLAQYPKLVPIEGGDNVPNFAFPHGVKLRVLEVSGSASEMSSLLVGQQPRRNASCHTFLMKTDSMMNGVFSDNYGFDHIYGLCIVTKEFVPITTSIASGEMVNVETPICYCLISRQPFFPMHQDILQSLLNLLNVSRLQTLTPITPVSDTKASEWVRPIQLFEVEACVKLMHHYYRMKVPARGQWAAVRIPMDLPLVKFERPLVNEHLTLLSRWCCALAWSQLNVDTFVDLFELVLRETKIVVCEPNLALQSACVFSFAAIVQPIQWMGVFIPVLPDKLLAFVDAPVPFICGIHTAPPTLSDASDVGEETAVWYPASNVIWKHAKHVRCLPNRSKLVDKLSRYFTILHKVPTASRAVTMHKSPQTKCNYYPSAEDSAAVDAVLTITKAYVSDILSQVVRGRDQLKLKEVSDAKQARATGKATKPDFLSLFHSTQMCSMYLQRRDIQSEQLQQPRIPATASGGKTPSHASSAAAAAAAAAANVSSPLASTPASAVRPPTGGVGPSTHSHSQSSLI